MWQDPLDNDWWIQLPIESWAGRIRGFGWFMIASVKLTGIWLHESRRKWRFLGFFFFFLFSSTLLLRKVANVCFIYKGWMDGFSGIACSKRECLQRKTKREWRLMLNNMREMTSIFSVRSIAWSCSCRRKFVCSVITLMPVVFVSLLCVTAGQWRTHKHTDTHIRVRTHTLSCTQKNEKHAELKYFYEHLSVRNRIMRLTHAVADLLLRAWRYCLGRWLTK